MQRTQMPKGWLILTLVLMVPALLIHLDTVTFIEDESIRALVALEMELSGNYITPTLNGAFYYNKPPLYNWVIILSYRLFGEVSEWTARFPTLVFLMAYLVTIYYYARKHFSRAEALLMAAAFLTCGRILFWDSLLGLIDICFSWLMFWLFMVVYHQWRKGSLYRLFLPAYTLAALGFLMKGLPAVVFLGLTLLVQFIRKGAFRRLFSLAHVSGGVVFLVLVGSYYGAYAGYNGLEEVFRTLVSESAKRTVVEYGYERVFWHFLEFPLEMSYHFFPWSFLGIYFLSYRVREWIGKHDFIQFCFWCFIINLLPYWTSPEVYPRYLHMLAPLFFIICLYLHQQNRGARTLVFRGVKILFLVLAVAFTLFALAPFVWADRLEMVAGLPFKAGLVFVALVFLTVLQWKQREWQLWWWVLILLVIRLGCNWFVLPARNIEDGGAELRSEALRIGRQYRDRPLYIYGESEMRYHPSFFISKERKQILPHRDSLFEKEALYIIDPHVYPTWFLDFQAVDSLPVRHPAKYYYVGSWEGEAEERL